MMKIKTPPKPNHISTYSPQNKHYKAKDHKDRFITNKFLPMCDSR